MSEPQLPSTKSICYLGAFDPDHARNRIIRSGLEARGWQISLAPLPTNLNLRQTLPLLWHTMRTEAAHCDALIVAEGNQLLAPLAVGLGRLLRKPVIVDSITGLYESRVVDNNTAKPNSWRSRGYRALDRWNLGAAAGAFTDTMQHKAAFQEQLGRVVNRMAVVSVGVDQAWIDAPSTPEPASADEPLLVQFYGNYTPYHGTEVILRALSWLNTDPRFRFEMIGHGPTYKAARDRARLLGLKTLDFIDPPDTATLMQMISKADICLGVFARRSKTDHVVPQRVMECMAMGKLVVTAESSAIDEYFTANEDLITVQPSNPGELAKTLRRLAEAPDLRETVALTGARTVHERYTPEQVVAPLIALLERII